MKQKSAKTWLRIEMFGSLLYETIQPKQAYKTESKANYLLHSLSQRMKKESGDLRKVVAFT